MTEGTLAAPLVSLLLGYLLGSIPFGILLTRLAGAGDLRSVGSGNIGATNVLRTGRKGLAALTLVLDALKGTAAVLITAAIGGDPSIAAAAAVIGHMYPVWLRFRGGKGVATVVGVLIGLHPPAAAVYAIVWLAMLAITRYSSVAGITAALVAPVAVAWFGRFDLTLLFLGLALLVFWKHRGNVDRLLSGTEPRVGRSANG